jgi:hypothetical protein
MAMEVVGAGGFRGFKINADVIADYAKKVDTTADELNGATDSVAGSALTVESFGDLGAQVGLGESYAHASEALRRQLFGGCAALRSASEALHKVMEHHAGVTTSPRS